MIKLLKYKRYSVIIESNGKARIIYKQNPGVYEPAGNCKNYHWNEAKR